VRCHHGDCRTVAKLGRLDLGNKPTEIREVERASFKADPSQSNRIWIAGQPIEEWLGARVASSPCCSVCGDSECRTLEMGNDTFEDIPAELILKAALIAASRLVGPGTGDRSRECIPECCPE
jgi:hypothetical protein